LLNIRQDIDNRKNAAEEKQRDRNNNKPSELN
jgi:hypothetical protein